MTERDDLHFGLDTFGDVTVDAAGALAPAGAGRSATSWPRPSWPTRSASTSSASASTTATTSPSRRRTSCWPPSPAQTERIRLGSAVTVLSSDDPVRVFERFSTLDAVSGGRAEVILGRGSFTESFPLFGFPLDQYEQLFEEKLDLFAELLKQQPVTWSGQTRAALRDQTVYPPTESGRSRPGSRSAAARESVVRAARYGLPLMLAIIGGAPMQFAPVRRPLPPGARALRPARAAGRRALARLRRRTDEQALDEIVAALRGDARTHRTRARLAPIAASSSSRSRRAGRGALSSARPRPSPRRSSRSPPDSACRVST